MRQEVFPILAIYTHRGAKQLGSKHSLPSLGVQCSPRPNIPLEKTIVISFAYSKALNFFLASSNLNSPEVAKMRSSEGVLLTLGRRRIAYGADAMRQGTAEIFTGQSVNGM